VKLIGIYYPEKTEHCTLLSETGTLELSPYRSGGAV